MKNIMETLFYSPLTTFTSSRVDSYNKKCKHTSHSLCITAEYVCLCVCKLN